MREGWWRVAPAYALGALLGLLLGIVGAFLAPVRPVPWFSVGVAVAVVGNIVVPYHLGRAAGSSAGAVVPAVTWLLTTVYLGTQRQEGDLVVTGSGWGLTFLVLGAVAAGLTIPRVRPALRRAARRAEERRSAVSDPEFPPEEPDNDPQNGTG